MDTSPQGHPDKLHKSLYSSKNNVMTILIPLRLAETHVDYKLLVRLEDAIYKNVDGRERFCSEFPKLLRQAIDEVIDPARSKRFTLDEIEKTEKTYLGTKVEILLRNYLGFERGKQMDLLIDEVEVDVKNTTTGAWTIPNEALGHVCILISTNERKAYCSFGLIVIRPGVLNRGLNRDQKTTIKKSELTNVHWLLRDSPYPPNFWLGLEPEVRQAIISPRGGANRVAMLFRLCQGRPISRDLIEALAQQKEPMRRLRKNGGARDSLGLDGIEVLSGKTQSRKIAAYGLPCCESTEYISITVGSDENNPIS